MDGILRLVTSRREKAEEARRLGFDVEQEPLELPEPQSLDPREIAAHKARAAWQIVGHPVVVEDSALAIGAWGGFPGALVKWMEKSAGLTGIARMLDPFPDRSATARCALCYFDGRSLVEALGECPGSIAPDPRGTAGFGWDALFIPEGQARTFAEMPPEVKDAVSHRGRAWMVLGEKLGLNRRKPQGRASSPPGGE